MRTRDEVIKAFTPAGKLDSVQQSALLKVEVAFKECAVEAFDMVPECPDRTAALRKLLEAKMTCIQAITHVSSTSTPAQVQKTEEKKNGKQK
jgi:hypothetical protein